MADLSNSITYVLLFISLYFEVFLVITYFETHAKMKEEDAELATELTHFPTVSIMVPCWNEESTLGKTIHSLLNLNYPKDKLKIIIIDDGSTDNTWAEMQKFADNPSVAIYHKKNGGKFTALNFGLSKITSEFVGCLDADSYVDPNALQNIVRYFKDPETMAVTPSVKIYEPKTIIQLIQRVEYSWGIFIRKMLSYIGALYVTPGPFSIFRVRVFEALGGYRHAHQTEDMELALRMQTHRYKIANAHNAVVYTVSPPTLKKLYKQRLRWTYGFIKNVIDYRFILFKKDYGNLGIFILPMASISIITGLYIVGVALVSTLQKLANAYVRIETVGLHFTSVDFNFDLFTINTQFVAIISTIAFLGTLILVLMSRRMADGKLRFGLDLLYFMTLYTFIAPLWMGKAVYNAIFSVKTYWR